MKTIDDFENNKLKTFNILNQPFEGEIVTTWIQDAKVKMTGYREEAERIRLEKERETKSFEESLAALRAEANEAHQHVAKLRGELDRIYQSLLSKNQEIASLQLQLAERVNNLTEQQNVNQTLRNKLTEKELSISGFQSKVHEHEERLKLLIQQHTSEIERLQKDHATAQQSTNILTSKLQSTENEVRILDQKLEAEAKRTQSLSIELKNSEQHNRTLELRIEGLNINILNMKERLSHHERITQNVSEQLAEIKPRLEEIHLSFRQQEEVIKHLEISLLGIIKSGWVRLGIKIGIPWLSRWYKGLFARDKETGVLIVLKPGWDNPLRLKEYVLNKINELLRILDQSK